LTHLPSKISKENISTQIPLPPQEMYQEKAQTKIVSPTIKKKSTHR